MNRFFHSLIKKRDQYVFYLDHPSAIVTITPKTHIVITDVTRNNVDQVIDFREEQIKDTFNKFLDEQQYGIYAYLDSQVVGHAWAKICKEDHCKVNGYLEIQFAEALIHFCKVKVEQRGQNIYPMMLAALCGRLFDRANVRRILIDTEIDNIPSQRGIIKAGFKPLGKGTYLQIYKHLVYEKFITQD